VANGVRFAWLTFDEYYGRNGCFLRELDHLGQNYVAEVPVDFMAWTRRPDVLYRQHGREQRPGRKKRYPRLKVKNNPRGEVRNILSYSPVMRARKWQDYYVKDGSKGPRVWQVKHITVYLADEDGLPSRPYHLLVARNALDHNEVKYFVSNAPPGTSTEMLVRVAFSRWTIERAFEDSKTELGMDHFEVRKFGSIQRHLFLSCLSHVFLSEFCLKHRGEKSRLDRMPSSHGGGPALSDLVSQRTLFPETGRIHCRAIGVNATTKQQSRSQPSTPHNKTITCDRYKTQKHTQMSLESLVAL